MFVLFATILVGQKPQDVSGTVLDSNGDRVVETTVLLLAEDGTEVQRTQTSKKRLGRGGGVFEFKKVVPGKYKVDIDAGDSGKLNTDVEVSDDDQEEDGEDHLLELQSAEQVGVHLPPVDQPIPGAVSQIHLLVFQEIDQTNGVPDAPDERVVALRAGLPHVPAEIARQFALK